MTTRRKREPKAEEPQPRAVRSTAKEPAIPLEATLGYRFHHPELLHLALTHRSHPYEARSGDAAPKDPAPTTTSPKDQKNEPGTDNEQLEFVGDAVLGLIVTEALYRHFPQCSEGELTRLRASLVSRQRMAQLGTELGLGDHLKMGRSAEANGGRRKPALLANAAEAVVAAVYLDSVKNPEAGLSAVRALIDRLLIAPELPSLRAALARDGGRGAMRDGKTLLQERVQAETSGKLRYVDIGETGPAHQRRFAVEVRLEAESSSIPLATAEGSSKKEAQQRAATLALAEWNPDLIPNPKPRHPKLEAKLEAPPAADPTAQTLEEGAA
jgi:ribonuclease III